VSGALVLVVDDDEAIRGALSNALRGEGHRVLVARDGREGAEMAALHGVDLVLTDLAMPRHDGFELIARIRAVSRVPILVLSVRGAEDDKVRALDLGADDHVVKPFAVGELLARVRAHLRRASASSPAVLTFRDLTIDTVRRRVVQGDREVRLTPTELTLLELLARHAGCPLTHAQIAARAWGGADHATRDTVRVHVSSLRRKIEPDPANPRYIVSEPWVGYRFIGEPT
jgi:two-component system KDP operon response regulator KdpE